MKKLVGWFALLSLFLNFLFSLVTTIPFGPTRGNSFLHWALFFVWVLIYSIDLLSMAAKKPITHPTESDLEKAFWIGVGCLSLWFFTVNPFIEGQLLFEDDLPLVGRAVRICFVFGWPAILILRLAPLLAKIILKHKKQAV